MYQTLISTSQLLTCLTDPSWVVVDCRYDLRNKEWGLEQYLTGHIPGAVYASLSKDLSGPKTATSGRHPLPDPKSTANTFGRLGITRAKQVVCYDQDVGMYAARFWWMLRYLGHSAVAVVDGGFKKWTLENQKTQSGLETNPAVTFSGSPQQHKLLDTKQVLHGLSRSENLLVDARAPERYQGASESLDRVAGHIPGAKNYFFKNNLDSDNTFLSPAVLRKQLSAILGDTPPEKTTMYCGSGVTACHNLLAMEQAGLPGARLYPGSWSEWSNDPARPVEREPNHSS